MRFLLATLLFAFVAAQHEAHRVEVDVYYESLCPDSIKFFTKQLYPSLQGNLSNFVNLTLIPYGKSKQKIDALNQIEFECHHGPDECQGNKIQACALAIINRTQPTPNLGYNKIAVGFINCLMDKVDRSKKPVDFPIDSCAALNQVTNANDISNCANHIDGVNYLAALGEKTSSFQSPLISVPTIVFNKRYAKEDSDLAQSNFIKAVCQYIHHDKPEECTRSGASSVSLPLVAMVSCIFFYFF